MTDHVTLINTVPSAMTELVRMNAVPPTVRTIKLGTGICLVVEHDPIVLAKTVATLDWLSHGRVLLGIGGGWNREEMAHHGTPFQRRWQVLIAEELARVRRGDSALDEYAATSEAETFAVAVEHFFMAPAHLGRRHPELMPCQPTACGQDCQADGSQDQGAARSWSARASFDLHGD